MSGIVRQGEVRRCCFNKAEAGVGSEMRVVWKDRWVIIVSADKWNQCLRNQLVSIVPITSLSPGHQPREDEVLLDPLDTGLKVRSVTSCNQHLSVDRLRLGAKIGQIPDRKMRQITSCLAAVFGLEAYW